MFFFLLAKYNEMRHVHGVCFVLFCCFASVFFANLSTVFGARMLSGYPVENLIKPCSLPFFSTIFFFLEPFSNNLNVLEILHHQC